MAESVEARRLMLYKNSVEIEKTRLPMPAGNDILIKTRYSLVSIGTEIGCYAYVKWGVGEVKDDPFLPLREDNCPLTAPMGAGYAAAGDVIAVGERVQSIKTGDRVIACAGHGDYAVCPDDPGTVLKIPDNVNYKQATFNTLASVALHGVRRGSIKIGESVTVMGAGVVGLLAMQLAKLNGGYPVIVADIEDTRLALAKKLGADHTINSRKSPLVDGILKLTENRGSACVIEAVGIPSVLKSAMRIAETGGRVVVMGSVRGEVSLDLFHDLTWRELSIIGAQQPRNPLVDTIYHHFTQQQSRRYCLDLISRGELMVDDMITHEIPFDKGPEMYETLAAGRRTAFSDEDGGYRDMIGVLFKYE